PGSRFPVPGSWFPVPGSWFLVPGSWFRGSWFRGSRGSRVLRSLVQFSCPRLLDISLLSLPFAKLLERADGVGRFKVSDEAIDPAYRPLQQTDQAIAFLLAEVAAFMPIVNVVLRFIQRCLGI